MSSLIQKSERSDLIPLEKKSLRITQWKYVSPTHAHNTNLEGLEVCINYYIFFIYDMTLSQFNKINHEHRDIKYVYEYIRSAVICLRCGGSGIVDWVNRATQRENYMINLHDVINYVRNKKGPITILSDYGDTKTYISTPNKRVGENFCPDCYGCGIKLRPLCHVCHEGTTVFDPS